MLDVVWDHPTPYWLIFASALVFVGVGLALHWVFQLCLCCRDPPTNDLEARLIRQFASLPQTPYLVVMSLCHVLVFGVAVQSRETDGSVWQQYEQVYVCFMNSSVLNTIASLVASVSVPLLGLDTCLDKLDAHWVERGLDYEGKTDTEHTLAIDLRPAPPAAAPVTAIPTTALLGPISGSSTTTNGSASFCGCCCCCCQFYQRVKRIASGPRRIRLLFALLCVLLFLVAPIDGTHIVPGMVVFFPVLMLYVVPGCLGSLYAQCCLSSKEQSHCVADQCTKPWIAGISKVFILWCVTLFGQTMVHYMVFFLPRPRMDDCHSHRLDDAFELLLFRCRTGDRSTTTQLCLPPVVATPPVTLIRSSLIVRLHLSTVRSLHDLVSPRCRQEKQAKNSSLFTHFSAITRLLL